MTQHPAADLDRRTSAFVLDRLVEAGIAGGAAMFLGGAVPGVAAGAVAAAAMTAVLGAVEGATGATPGKAVLGLRTITAGATSPPGILPGLARALVRIAAGPPTAGLGWAVLGWTAAADPSGRRRGWHDHLGGCEVVDVRREPAAPEPAETPRDAVNLTALRLVEADPVEAPAKSPIDHPHPQPPGDAATTRPPGP